jgi:long-chain acyl-CoA synthetase
VNLVSVLDAHPDDDVALVSRTRPTTYGELRRQTAELRHGLLGLGVVPGDRVAVLTANNWYFVVTFLAVVGCGAVAVPLNPASPAPELMGQLAAVGATVAIAGPSARVERSGPDRGALGVDRLVAIDPAGTEGAIGFDGLFTGEHAPVEERADADLACLLMTAGTGARPKPAMLTHGSLLANQAQMQQHAGGVVHRTDVALGVIPLHHVYGLNVVLLLTLRAGGAVVLVERFDPASSLETIANHRVSVVAGVPAMWRDWLALPAPAEAFSGVRMAISGAAALGAPVAAAFRQRFGLTIHEGYGLTEASPAVTSSVPPPGADAPVRDGSIGVPLPGVELRLVDADGDGALPGDPGEIWVRGPNVFAGYWGDPVASRAVLSDDGWLRTGDVAVADDDGWLSIVDRAKDVVNVSGFNVFPAEVEDAIAEHPAVATVAVVGVPHPHSGETVRAYVVLRPGQSVEEDALIEFCAGRLARYKCPTKVTFVDGLPHGGTGKLLRRALRAPADARGDASPAREDPSPALGDA